MGWLVVCGIWVQGARELLGTSSRIAADSYRFIGRRRRSKFIGIAKNAGTSTVVEADNFPEAGHCIHLEQPTIFYEKVTALLEGAI